LLQVGEAPKPVPAPGENPDPRSRDDGQPLDWGELRPSLMRVFLGCYGHVRKDLRMDVAGEIEAIGAGVASFKPATRVFGLLLGAQKRRACGLCLRAGVRTDRRHAGKHAL